MDTDQLIRPLYPFGHGLTYTTFAYANLRVSPERVSAMESVTVSVEVTNTGKRTGIETVQLYLRDPLASTSRPIAELKGFHRVELRPGQTATVTFEVPAQLMAFYDAQVQCVVEPGVIEVKIGASAEAIRLEKSFEISGETLHLTARSVFFSSSRAELKTGKRPAAAKQTPRQELA